MGVLEFVMALRLLNRSLLYILLYILTTIATPFVPVLCSVWAQGVEGKVLEFFTAPEGTKQKHI